jgi:hypothetical protein
MSNMITYFYFSIALVSLDSGSSTLFLVKYAIEIFELKLKITDKIIIITNLYDIKHSDLHSIQNLKCSKLSVLPIKLTNSIKKL